MRRCADTSRTGFFLSCFWKRNGYAISYTLAPSWLGKSQDELGQLQVARLTMAEDGDNGEAAREFP